MKTFLLTALLAVLITTGYSQQPKRIIYLTVWFDFNFGLSTPDHYLLRADLGNSSVPEVTNMVNYADYRKAKRPPDVYFYSEKNDSAKRLFNYFTNPTAGLEYLGKHGWQLVSVVNEHLVDYKYQSRYRVEGTLVDVSTRPIFYFKKEVE